MGFNYHGITTDNTKQIVHFVKELKYEDIPPVVIERAKMMVLHTVGVCLCSSELQEIKDAIEIAKEMSPGGEEIATIWADGKKVSWEAATFVAGTMGDMLDWEDCSVTGHPSAGIITTAVVAGEVLKKSGKDVLTAIVAGYEVYQRIALAGRTNIVSYNIFGNLTVLMKLLDLSESLNYLYGFKNESTVTMIKTAMLGIENMEDAFDDGTAYLNHTVEPDITWLTKELGTEWFLMSMILVKHSPANVFVQTYAELARNLINKYKFNPDDVEEIIIRPSVAFRHWYSDWGYKSVTQAQFSIPYCTACAMYHPEPGAIWYQPETMVDPKIVALMNKVKADGFVKMGGNKFIKDLIEGKHPEKFMTVRLKDGTEYTESLFTHPGHPSYMLTRDEFKDDFRMLTRYVLTPKKIEGAIETICHLDEYDDVSGLPQYFY